MCKEKEKIHAHIKWVHHYTPKTEELSKQWTDKGSPPPKRASIVLFAEKVIETVFWVSYGIILIENLEKGKTIKFNVLCQFTATIERQNQRKTPSFGKEKSAFHQCNEPQQ